MKPQNHQGPAIPRTNSNPKTNLINENLDNSTQRKIFVDKLRNVRRRIFNHLINDKLKISLENSEASANGVFFDGLNSVPRDPKLDPPANACFKCWRTNHKSESCFKGAMFIYCFNCGRKDNELQDCPRCKDAYIKQYPENIREIIECHTINYHDMLLQKVLFVRGEQSGRDNAIQESHTFKNHNVFPNRPGNSYYQHPIYNFPSGYGRQLLNKPSRSSVGLEPLDQISRRIDSVLNNFVPTEQITGLFRPPEPFVKPSDHRQQMQRQFNSPFFQEFGERMQRQNKDSLYESQWQLHQHQFQHPLQYGSQLEANFNRQSSMPLYNHGTTVKCIDEILQEEEQVALNVIGLPQEPSTQFKQNSVFSRLQNRAVPLVAQRNRPNRKNNMAKNKVRSGTEPYKKNDNNPKKEQSNITLIQKPCMDLNELEKAKSALDYVSPYLLRPEEKSMPPKVKDVKNISRSDSPQVEIIEVICNNDKLETKNGDPGGDSDNLPKSIKRRFGGRLGGITHTDSDSHNEIDGKFDKPDDGDGNVDSSILIHIDEAGRRSLFAS